MAVSTRPSSNRFPLFLALALLTGCGRCVEDSGSSGSPASGGTVTPQGAKRFAHTSATENQLYEGGVNRVFVHPPDGAVPAKADPADAAK